MLAAVPAKCATNLLEIASRLKEKEKEKVRTVYSVASSSPPQKRLFAPVWEHCGVVEVCKHFVNCDSSAKRILNF